MFTIGTSARSTATRVLWTVASLMRGQIASLSGVKEDDEVEAAEDEPDGLGAVIDWA